MEQEESQEKIEFKNSVKIALKTLSACFIITMLFFCSMFVISPKTSLKLNEMFGFTKVQELNYQMIYARSKKVTDLYNVIIFEEKQKNYSKELYYINEMLARTDYNDFCVAIDKASIDSASDKNLIPYSSNVNGFLVSRKVICLYSLNQGNTDSFVYQQAKDGKITESSFATLVDLIYSDGTLTNAQKKSKIESLIELSQANGESMVSLQDLIDERVNKLKNNISAETDDNQKIILNYSLLRVYGARYYVYQVLGDDVKKTENLNLYNETKSVLSALINS